MDTLRALSRSPWRTVLGALAGALAGAAYAHFIGCHTGTCPLTGNVWTAALFFGFTGAVVFAPGPRAADVPAPREPGQRGAGDAGRGQARES
jgi:uncharacterized protein DUF6132